MEGKCTVVSKKSLLFAGPFGIMAYLSGVTFIDRNGKADARQNLEETVNSGLNHRHNVQKFEAKYFLILKKTFFKEIFKTMIFF
jgi:hypothetical protein